MSCQSAQAFNCVHISMLVVPTSNTAGDWLSCSMQEKQWAATRDGSQLVYV